MVLLLSLKAADGHGDDLKRLCEEYEKLNANAPRLIWMNDDKMIMMMVMMSMHPD